MSLSLYNQALINGNTGTTANLQFAEFVLKLAVLRKGNGKVKTSETTFAICGPASATALEVEEAATQKAEQIAKLSDGVIMGLFKKMGKYRNDEQPEVVLENKKQYGIVYMSNNPLVENPDSSDPLPLKVSSTKLFIPWLADTTSRQDMAETIKNPVEVNAMDFYMATSRFQDVEKSAIEVYPTVYLAGVLAKEYTKAPTFQLVNNDVSAGGSDHVASEAFATIIDGDDDQE